MPEEITTDDSFLSKSRWENDFDLIKGLDETTAVCYYPKIAERILPDDTIIPSPINSCVNSQDIEMTSKTNFIEKNPAPSVVVVSAKKKRKMVNVTNNQQEDKASEMKGGKNSLFRKSVAGKENQDFDVGYAESEASNLTTATVDTPAKHFEMTDDSLDLTLTEAIINVKKSMFMRKKSSVNVQFNENKDANDSDLRKDTDCQPVSMSTTEAALRYPEDDDMQDVNKSFDQPEDGGEDILEMETDLVPENAVNKNSEKKLGHECSLLSQPTTAGFASPKKSRLRSDSIVSSQDDSLTFNKPVRPFSRPSRRRKNDNFNVDYNETPIINSDNDKGELQDFESSISAPSSQEETSSRPNVKRSTLFSKRSSIPAEFKVNFEETESECNNFSSGNDIDKGGPQDFESSISAPSSQEETSSRPNVKRSTLFNKRRTNAADFKVNFEETESECNNISSGNDIDKEGPQDFESSISTPSSQEETSSRPNVKRSTLFNKRSTNAADFKVNFEETESECNNISSRNDSVRENDITKTPGNNETDAELLKGEESLLSLPSSQGKTLPLSNVKRSTLFNKRKTKTADFKVNFEETGSGSTNVSSVDAESDVSKTHEDTLASESAIMSQKAEAAKSKRKSLFVRRSARNKEKSFNVPFEQTITTSDSLLNQTSNELSLNISAKTQSSSKKSKAERKTILFQKKNKDEEDPFSVSCNETNSFRNVSKNDSLRRAVLFGKRKKTGIEDTFDVACEESQVEKDSVESPCPSDLEGSFNEKSPAVSPLSVSGMRNRSHQKLVEESPVSSITASSQRTSSSMKSSKVSMRSQNSSFGFSNVSSASSRNATVIDKTDKSIKKTPHISNRTLDSSIAQSSFNDDNLNGWMSDHSDHSEEDQPETVPTTEMPSPPPLKEKPVTSNNVQKVIDWELKFKEIAEKAGRGEDIRKKKCQPLPQEKKKIVRNNKNLNKSPRLRLKKPAPYATKRLYKFLIDRLEPKFGMDATIRAEELVGDICETVKIVIRKKTYQKKLINGLKIDMAKLGIIETTNDFYNFIRNFLPEAFRSKSIPRIQPITCEIWPPQDVANIFDKIL